MSRDVLVPLVNDLLLVVSAGTDNGGVGKLSRHAAALSAEGGDVAALAEDAQRTMAADADETPLPMLDFLTGVVQARPALAEFAAATGEIREIPEGGFWSTPMPAEILYTLVPETRPFAKRSKPPEQIENIEAAGRRGQVADLRLVQIFLKMLTEKEKAAGNPVADVVARVAIPAYGPVILPDLWPSLAPENRTFIAAYKIDVEQTLARLLEKSGDKKKPEKGANVMKAVEKLMTTVNEDGSSIGPESLPIIKLALKHAPDQGFRRKLADIVANMGTKGADALPELIDVFEHGLTRDYYLIRPIVVLGKENPDVADVVIRALSDRDSTVRLMAAFNLGQMGNVAERGLRQLEDVAETDQETKVRETATKMLNKLRIRFGLITPEELVET